MIREKFEQKLANAFLPRGHSACADGARSRVPCSCGRGRRRQGRNTPGGLEGAELRGRRSTASNRRGLAGSHPKDVDVVEIVAAVCGAASEIVVLILLLKLVFLCDAAQSVAVVLTLLNERRQVQQQAGATCGADGRDEV